LPREIRRHAAAGGWRHAIHWAIIETDEDLVDLLVAARRREGRNAKASAARDASLYGRPALILKLLKCGAMPTRSHERGRPC